MGVKRSKIVKYLFYKNNAEKNGTFHIQIMFKGGKHARITCDTCSQLSMRTQKQRRIFWLEQLSIISVVSLLLTFNKDTALGVLSFSMQHFYVSKYNQNISASEHLRRNKQEMSARKKTIKEKQTTLFYFIRK